MVKRCTVCNHHSRPDIDRALMANVSYRLLAREFGLSASALCRHTKHLARALDRQRQEKDQAHHRDVLDKLDLLETRFNRLFHDAHNSHSLRVALECLREYLRLLTLQDQVRHRLGS